MTAGLVRDAGRTAVTIPGDIQQEQHCVELVETTVRELGGLDVLVNNAAYQMAQTDGLLGISTEQLDRVFKTNLYAMFWITKAAVPHLAAGASIINTTSVQAYDPSPPLLDYATTKAGILNFTRGLAQQLAEKGIRVNAVAPGTDLDAAHPRDHAGGEGGVVRHRHPAGPRRASPPSSRRCTCSSRRRSPATSPATASAPPAASSLGSSPATAGRPARTLPDPAVRPGGAPGATGPARFALVGTGYRADFFRRLAAALPERFALTGAVSRTAERRAEVERDVGRARRTVPSGTCSPRTVRTSSWSRSRGTPHPTSCATLVAADLPVLDRDAAGAGRRRACVPLWADVGASGLVQVAEHSPVDAGARRADPARPRRRSSAGPRRADLLDARVPRGRAGPGAARGAVRAAVEVTARTLTAPLVRPARPAPAGPTTTPRARRRRRSPRSTSATGAARCTTSPRTSPATGCAPTGSWCAAATGSWSTTG